MTVLGFAVMTSSELAEVGPKQAAERAHETVTRATQGFWIHLDLDVLDKQELPAVDSPEPEGLTFTMLSSVLQHLVASPYCVGLEVTIYDPDLDPTGHYAGLIVRCLEEACQAV